MTAPTTIHSIDLIASNPEIRSGRPHILGTSVTVADVVTVMHAHGLDADAVAEWYGLELNQVYAALAYYYSNKAALDQQMADLIATAERLLAEADSDDRPARQF